MPWPRALALVSVVTLAAALPARAEDPREDESAAEPRASEAAKSSLFLPFTLVPGLGGQAAVAGAYGGYDSARGTALHGLRVEARVAGGLSVIAGAVEPLAASSPQASLGLRMQVLSQDRHGVALAAAVFYEREGFNLQPNVLSVLSVGRSGDKGGVFVNAAYGHGLEEGERFGEVRIAGLRRVGRRLHVGLDARARLDLELEQPEPPGEAYYDLAAGPLATYTIGRFALTAQTGASAAQLHGEPTRVGIMSRLGAGVAF